MLKIIFKRLGTSDPIYWRVRPVAVVSHWNAKWRIEKSRWCLLPRIAFLSFLLSVSMDSNSSRAVPFLVYMYGNIMQFVDLHAIKNKLL